jgi:aspartyl-tRNA(Asn)/glutamyl-tRNA(Gln) amidotransferase subunit A
MSDRFTRIRALNDALHFCEDFAASGPVDTAAIAHRGPFTGRIIGIKSNIRVAGQAWTAGIAGRASQIAQADAAVVAQLRAGGATLLSRLLMDEGALGAAADNPHFGRCENPVQPGHSAGGSSGGSAAAVAAGAVDAALGSDTMGSVRIPAAYCGVFGLKLGQGAVAMDGVYPLAPSLDALGVLAKSPAMIAQVLELLMPCGKPAMQVSDWLECPVAQVEKTAPVTRAFYETCHAALTGLIGPPRAMAALDLAGLRGDAFVLTEIEAGTTLGDAPGLSAGLLRLIAYGRAIDAKKQGQLRTRLAVAADVVRGALVRDCVLLMPTVADPAFAHGARPPAGQADFTALANIAGCPAIAIPMANAVPAVSVQLIGPMGSERALVALAQALTERIG